jgi:hypothetical protein
MQSNATEDFFDMALDYINFNLKGIIKQLFRMNVFGTGLIDAILANRPYLCENKLISKFFQTRKF